MPVRDPVHGNRRRRHGADFRPHDAGGSAHACPGPTECVAVDSAGRALFGAPGRSTWTAEPVAGAAIPLEDISCPSTAECVTVDAAGDAFLGACRSAAEKSGWLRELLMPDGAAERIDALRKAGGYRLEFAALYALTLRIRWFQVPPGAHLGRASRSRTPVLVASGAAAVRRRGDTALKLVLTGRGRRLLARSSGVTLTATGSLTAGGQTVRAQQTFRLIR